MNTHMKIKDSDFGPELHSFTKADLVAGVALTVKGEGLWGVIDRILDDNAKDRADHNMVVAYSPDPIDEYEVAFKAVEAIRVPVPKVAATPPPATARAAGGPPVGSAAGPPAPSKSPVGLVRTGTPSGNALSTVHDVSAMDFVVDSAHTIYRVDYLKSRTRRRLPVTRWDGVQFAINPGALFPTNDSFVLDSTNALREGTVVTLRLGVRLPRNIYDSSQKFVITKPPTGSAKSQLYRIAQLGGGELMRQPSGNLVVVQIKKRT